MSKIVLEARVTTDRRWYICFVCTELQRMVGHFLTNFTILAEKNLLNISNGEVIDSHPNLMNS